MTPSKEPERVNSTSADGGASCKSYMSISSCHLTGFGQDKGRQVSSEVSHKQVDIVVSELTRRYSVESIYSSNERRGSLSEMNDSHIWRNPKRIMCI